MCDMYSSLSERKQNLSQQHRCFVCLKVGHFLKNCPSLEKKSCCYCGKRGAHNRCLCPHRFKKQDSDTFVVTEPTKFIGSGTTDGSRNTAVNTTHTDLTNQVTAVDPNISLTLLASGERVLLQTATCSVESIDGSIVSKVRILLDSASQRTFMTGRLARELRLASESKELLSVSTFGATKATEIDTYVVHFKLKLKDGSHMVMYANVLKQITGSIQRSPLHEKDLEFLQLIPNEKIADIIPHTQETTNIDLLIGSDYFWDIVEGGKIILPSGMFMLPSKLGYIVTGRCPKSSQFTGLDPCALFVAAQPVGQLQCCVSTSTTKSLDLESFWSLESIGIRDSVSGDDDEKALEQFCETVKFENNRYQVTWPWKPDSFSLSNNYSVAFRRLKSLISRLKMDAKLLQSYNDILKLQLDLGIIEVVDDSKLTNSRKYYLPHHPVLTPNKATTKTRIVYDASSKASK